MDSDDDNDERDADEYFHLYAANDSTSEPARLLVQLQRIIPRQTIIYIQYCLLRVPFLLLYDYLFTEQFTSLFDQFLGYSSDVLDKEKNVLFAPISYILHSYFFRLLIEINLFFSIPILGNHRRFAHAHRTHLFASRPHLPHRSPTMFRSTPCDLL